MISAKIEGPIRARAKPVAMSLSEADSWIYELSTQKPELRSATA